MKCSARSCKTATIVASDATRHCFLGRLRWNAQERARAEGEGGDVSSAHSDEENGDNDESDSRQAEEEDGLQSEVLRGKNMNVSSMDALKKRIEVRRNATRTFFESSAVYRQDFWGERRRGRCVGCLALRVDVGQGGQRVDV